MRYGLLYTVLFLLAITAITAGKWWFWHSAFSCN